MKKTYIGFAGLSLLLLLGTQTVHAQQGFGTDKPHRSAAVDIQSSKRGLLIPRVNLTSIEDAVTITKPAQSLMVYNQATTANTDSDIDVTPGYYYWDKDRWVRFAQQGDITAINLKGDVTGPTNATVVGAIQGVEVSNVNPTANQVLTFVPGTGTEKGKWVPTSITPDVITEGKDVTAGSNKVSLSEGAKGASLKDYTVDVVEANIKLENLGGELPVNKLVKGQDGQVLVTKGGISTWVSQTEIVPTTTNTLTKKTTGEGANQTVDQNTIVSTVNGKTAEVRVIDNVTNTVTGSSIVTTVNGVASTSVDLTDAIQAGQKTVEVVNGTNTTVTKTPETGDSKHTKYAVNVSNEAIQAAQKLTTVSQGAGVKVTHTTTTKEGSSTTDYNVAIDTNGGKAGDVLTVVDGGSTTGENKVEWKTPNYRNLYTHNDTLVNVDQYHTRKVFFGEFNNMVFQKGDQSHEFTYDADHTGINLFGNVTSSIGLISNKGVNNDESLLKLKHDNETSEINANALNGLKIVAEYRKDITFGTSERILGKAKEYFQNVVFQGNGGVKVVNINKPEFKGEATDKVVVADTDGVLKTVDRKKVAPQFFYMPAVIFNTKTQGTELKRDLYQDYVNQFTATKGTAYNIAHGANGGSLPYDGGVIGSTGAPAVMDTFTRGELHYYVTYYDKNVFANISIDANGVLKYDIIGTATPASYMNIVFVIK
ncbi:hypothetical protein AV926_04095 [Myroides marinus]|uniref:Collagen triple helix repeat-containing protein n=1 Tax=Myroides marinus TaxID=703342 RepID=A0A164AEC2_9FLAO|nr:hypothetical protein [Myroides marinus]KZE83702.1 hypothetical protein AV926_04095 [Myroides marinus]